MREGKGACVGVCVCVQHRKRSERLTGSLKASMGQHDLNKTWSGWLFATTLPE